MLTFSDQVWSRWLDLGGGFHLNRWRVPDYLHAAHDSRFVDVGYEILLKDEAALKTILPRVDYRFRSVSEEMLAILLVSLYGQKPNVGERSWSGCNQAVNDFFTERNLNESCLTIVEPSTGAYFQKPRQN